MVILRMSLYCEYEEYLVIRYIVQTYLTAVSVSGYCIMWFCNRFMRQILESLPPVFEMLIFIVFIMLLFSMLGWCFFHNHFTRMLCLGRLLRVDLIKCVSNVRRPIRTSVHTSVRSQKIFFDFNEICSVGRGRWVMHDGMQYDPIQGQGHEPMKVGNSAIFKGYLPHL